MFSRFQNLDNRVLERIVKIHKPALNRIMIVASKAGTFGTVWWAICMPFLLTPRWRLTGFNFVLGLAIAHLMGEIILKHIVRRARPCHRLDDEELLVNRPRYYSFPSGHTTASFAFVGVALLRCRLITFLPIVLLASLIAFSRIYLRVHYLTDVLVGILLGLVCGVGSVILFNSVVPVMFPGIIM